MCNLGQPLTAFTGHRHGAGCLCPSSCPGYPHDSTVLATELSLPFDEGFEDNGDLANPIWRYRRFGRVEDAAHTGTRSAATCYAVSSCSAAASNYIDRTEWLEQSLFTLLPVDLSGVSSATLSFWSLLPEIAPLCDEIEEPGDSRPGVEFDVINDWYEPGDVLGVLGTESDSWQFVEYDLASAIGQEEVYFRFRIPEYCSSHVSIDSYGPTTAWFIDDIRIDGQ